MNEEGARGFDGEKAAQGEWSKARGRREERATRSVKG